MCVESEACIDRVYAARSRQPQRSAKNFFGASFMPPSDKNQMRVRVELFSNCLGAIAIDFDFSSVGYVQLAKTNQGQCQLIGNFGKLLINLTLTLIVG
jgi:hypothetical protein